MAFYQLINIRIRSRYATKPIKLVNSVLAIDEVVGDLYILRSHANYKCGRVLNDRYADAQDYHARPWYEWVLKYLSSRSSYIFDQA